VESSSEAVFVKGRPLVGTLPDIIRHPAELCRKLMLEHDGALMRLNLGAGSVFLATRPEHVEHIVINRAENYWKGRIFQRIRFVFGDGLLLSEGERWKTQRRLQQPAFTLKRLRSQIPLMSSVISRRITGWEHAAERRTPMNVAYEMRRITMQVGAAAMFAHDISDELSDRIADAFEVFMVHVPMRFFTFFLPEWVPLPGGRRAKRAIAEIVEIIELLISERRRAPGDRGDLLSMLIDAADHEREGSSQAEAHQLLVDHVMTTLFGGYESTATALTWVWALLAQHPEVAERIKAEVDQVIGSGELTAEVVEQLAYTDMVVNEALRLYPPFWGWFRTAYNDDVIDGVRIPAGASIILCPYATQRDPRIWPDPDTFNPERFRAPPRHRFAYYPFQVGPRTCIGKSFALVEMKLVVARGVRDYRLELPRGFPMTSVVEATIRPRQVPWARVIKREPERARVARPPSR
jgi:cytochrome P450